VGESQLLQMTGILVLAMLAQWGAAVLRLPAILLLLLSGFLVGPGCELAGYPKLIDPDKLLGPLLFPIISLAVAVVLFEGGLSLTFAEIAGLRNVVWRLVTIGGLVTWGVGTVAAHLILGFGWPVSLLLGQLLIVTGPTVIGPLLRFVRPSGSVGAILKWEGIVIDPIGAMLAVLVLRALPMPDLQSALFVTMLGVLQTVIVGIGVGAAAATLIVVSLKRFWIPDVLQNGMILMLIAVTYCAANLLANEAGLFAVTILGIALANQEHATVTHIAEFKENLSILLVSVLFIVLASRLGSAEFEAVGARSLLFAAVMILVARPLSIAVSTWRSSLNWRERVFLASMAPRGIVAAAVTSVFAMHLSRAGYHESAELVPTVFVMIVVSVIFYSAAAPLVARLLGLSAPPTGFLIAGANPLALAIGKALQEVGATVLLIDREPLAIRSARLQGLPTKLGSIISRYVQENLELSGIGRLLALTPNQEANTLADISFVRTFGRENVFQLSVNASAEGRHERIDDDMQGRILFGKEWTYAQLMSRISNGAVVRRTPLTAKFTLADYHAQYGAAAIPLFVVDKSGVPTPIATDHAWAATESSSVLALIGGDGEQEPLAGGKS
jgi:NhaP-type Na+/H+ or K+/H+ antiporter